MTLAQEAILEGFRAEIDVAGRTIWVGTPNRESAAALFEEVTELDPDFELVKDIREACRIHMEAPGPTMAPGATVLDGLDPLHPDAIWKVVPSSRINNPNSPLISYLVAKVPGNIT